VFFLFSLLYFVLLVHILHAIVNYKIQVFIKRIKSKSKTKLVINLLRWRSTR